jgi:small conductance mechanosensitive channel
MRKKFKTSRELGLERMFETRSEAWEAVGLALATDQKLVQRARKRAFVLLVMLIGVIITYNNRHRILGERLVSTRLHPAGHWTHNSWDTPLQIGVVILVCALGWTFARDIGRAAGPTFMRRMDPSMAGIVGFLIRLATILIVLLFALHVAGIATSSIAVGGAFTAVVLGLAAQQTIGNLIAGLVLLSARPFRIGERVRLQAGAVGGQIEGIVSELGLLYTTLARGDDRIMIPNNVVLAAAVMPLREPKSVDVKVRLGSHIRPSQLQALLDQGVSIPTRGSTASVLLEEVDGDDVVVRVQATPESADDGARLADEIIAVVTSVTGEHATVNSQSRGQS